MKRSVSILLAVLMLASAFAVPAAARGYTLSVPKTEMAHNLEAFGLHTMNVYSTFTPPTIDGVVSTGEYPGPNNGCSLSAVPGDNMFFAPSSAQSYAGDQNGYVGRQDVTGYIADEDKPDYINNYLTYDEEYFYFGVTTLIPAIRVTNGPYNPDSTDPDEYNSDNKIIDAKGHKVRTGYWDFYTFVNFIQSEDLAQVNNTRCWNRYRLYKPATYTTAQSVKLSERDLYLMNAEGKYVATELDSYVDPDGVNWNATTYKAASNFTYKVTIQEDGKWGITFEGRMPLGDVLRLTDVEYEDGTPIDYVPGWGSWGCAIGLQAHNTVSDYTPSGALYTMTRNNIFYAQTGLPTRGYGTYDVGAYVGGFLFSNTIYKATGANRFLKNPVRFLGVYDSTQNYDEIYKESIHHSLVSVTSRVTRTRAPMLTSGVRGVNNRVVGVATTAASATGDSATLTVVLSVVMLLCAAGVVSVIVMKKRSQQIH